MVKDVKKLFTPLKKNEIVKAIWLYGSAIREGILKGHDVDVMILLDDTLKIDDKYEEEYKKVGIYINLIEEKAKEIGITLHFQSPKSLTLWWDLIRKGEPWAITSLRSMEIIHDPSEYIILMKRLLKKGELYSTEEKAERLLERAREKILEIRGVMIERIPIEMLDAATEAAQTALMSYGVFPPSPKEVSKKLKLLRKENLLEAQLADFYDDLLNMIEKIEKGTLSEFTGKETEKWLSRTKSFIFKMEEAIIKIEAKEREKGLSEAYKECIKLCEKALKTRYKKLPKDDSTKILLFKKNFIDTGKVDKIHYITLIELYDYQKKKKSRAELERAKYMDKTYIKALGLAIKNIKKEIKGGKKK